MLEALKHAAASIDNYVASIKRKRVTEMVAETEDRLKKRFRLQLQTSLTKRVQSAQA